MSFYDLNLTQGGDIKTARSFLNQLIDVLQEDISGSTSRRKYQHFVTGGVGPGVTSSLFQTVYDQDFTLQTANAVFDITFGLAPPNVISLANNGTAAITATGVDVTGKYLYPSSSLMMREKTDIYSQFSQILLGNANSKFKIPLDGAGQAEDIDVALFVAFKRLFSRDQIKRETFAMRFYQTASFVNTAGGTLYPDFPPLLVGDATSDGVTNLGNTSATGSAIYTDLNSATAQFTAFGGQYGEIVDSASTNRKVGLMFYDAGIAVFDLKKIVSGSQFLSGAIDAMHPAGVIMLGGEGTETYNTAKFIPDFVTSGSIDNVIDHICATRFQSGSMTAITFQNVTNINSTLVFCRVRADDANYSSNPTFIDNNGRIIVIDEGQEATQEPFTYVTSVGLYDDSSPPRLLAVAKLSRPVEKNSERDLTFRIRLDY
jgi:hypothetical protein